MPVLSPTTAFKDYLRYGAQLVTARFTVYTNGIPQGAPYYAATSTGSFTVDRSAEFRRTGQITIEVIPDVPPPALMPVNPSSLLAPFGTEIFVETGISAPNIADIIWVPNGLFVITTSAVDDTVNDCTITLDLSDRGWTIAQRTLKSPYNFPATPSGEFAGEIKALLNMVWNQQANVQPLVYNIVPTEATVPQASYDQGADPMQAAIDMATAVGYELYFDINGAVVGQPIPNPNTTPVTWNFTDDTELIQGLPGTGSAALFGGAYSTPVEVSVTMTRDGIFNDIVVQGTGDANASTYNGNGLQTTPPPILAEAAITNPQSPMWINGAMGDVPDFVQSSLITATGGTGLASSTLNTQESSVWTVTLSIAPNPILDVDDVVIITRPRVGLNNARVVLDTLTHTISYADISQITGRVLPTQ